MNTFTPDFNELKKVLKRERTEKPVYFEFHIDPKVTAPEEALPDASKFGGNKALAEMEYAIRFFKKAHCHHAMIPSSLVGFDLKLPHAEEKGSSISLNAGEHIETAEDLEKYPFPDIDNLDYSNLEKIEKYLPDNMKIMMPGRLGVLETTVRLAGYENFCFMLYEDRDLAKSLVNKIGETLFKHYKKALQYNTVQLIMVNDDWGFNTQTMLSHADMRELIVPWHEKFVKLAHDAGKLAVMHSCGNLDTLYEDIIEKIKFDGKHSYEDNIVPVEEMYERLHKRIAVLGGIDVDFLCRASPDAIYTRCKAMIERTMDRGGYALGSGNSIASYVPQENFQAMQKALIEF